MTSLLPELSNSGSPPAEPGVYLDANYIVDFVCFEKQLVIEIDGGQHFEQTAYDLERDTWLRNQGFSVLRFWNNQVLNEMEAVKEVILDKLTCQPPTLILPHKGGGNR
jgi:very-short-patch-repair endonuclease